jgi:MraZ protein
MLLTGTFVRAIDDKLRLAIPKRLRDALGTGPEQPLYVTPGTDRSLAVYTEETLGRLAERLAAASPAGAEVRAFSRLFYAQAQPAELDLQGRIRIPAELAGLARIGPRSDLLGVQDHGDLGPRSMGGVLAERQARYDQPKRPFAANVNNHSV